MRNEVTATTESSPVTIHSAVMPIPINPTSGSKPTTSAAVSLGGHGNRHKQKMSLELSLEDYNTIFYKNNLINDYEDNKLKKMILYTFGHEYCFNLKIFKDYQVSEEYLFKINLMPESLFTQDEVRNMLTNKKENIII